MSPIEALARFHFIELRLAEIERQFEDGAAAQRELDALGRSYTPYHDTKAASARARLIGLDAKQALFIERERLQEESFRLVQRAREVSEEPRAAPPSPPAAFPEP